MVYAQRTSGRFVTDDKELIVQKRNELAELELKNFVDNMTKIGFSIKEILSVLNTYISRRKN